MADMNKVRARDLTAPAQTMEFDGQERTLRFDMNTFRIAEDVYADEYGKDRNFAEIALELTKGRLGAIMAVYYGALVSGGMQLSWEHFSGTFKLTDIPGVKDQLTIMLADALPDPEDSGAPLQAGAEAPGSPSHGPGSAAEQ